MSKKNSERKPHLLIIAFAMGLFIGINFSIIAGANEPAHKYLDYFHQVFQLVTTEFVDEPENKNLFYGAIRGMLNSLDDPYTRFLDEDASSELQEMTTGKFVGIGVEVTIRDGELIVVTPIENSPAMKEGIEAGDKITKVNDEPVRDKGKYFNSQRKC
jgi:carboxyl-terminal processing protease